MKENHPNHLLPLNLGDPVLEDRLERAISPVPTPAGLEDRILQATLPLLRRRALARRGPFGLVGRIGQVPGWVRSVAASVVVAASLGVVLTTGSILQGAHTTVTLNSLDRDLMLAVAPVVQSSAVRWQTKKAAAETNEIASDSGSLGQELDQAIRGLDQALERSETQINRSEPPAGELPGESPCLTT